MLQRWYDGSGNTYADGNGDEHQARHARRPALALLVDDGIGNKEHVQQTVQDSHVKTDQQDDNLGEEQLERPEKEDPQTLAHGAHIKVLLRGPGLVTSLLPELLGAAGEDGRSVSLRNGEGDQDPGDEGDDELEPVEPAPPGIVGNETTEEGTDWRGELAFRLKPGAVGKV